MTGMNLADFNEAIVEAGAPPAEGKQDQAMKSLLGAMSDAVNADDPKEIKQVELPPTRSLIDMIEDPEGKAKKEDEAKAAADAEAAAKKKAEDDAAAAAEAAKAKPPELKKETGNLINKIVEQKAEDYLSKRTPPPASSCARGQADRETRAKA